MKTRKRFWVWNSKATVRLNCVDTHTTHIPHTSYRSKTVAYVLLLYWKHIQCIHWTVHTFELPWQTGHIWNWYAFWCMEQATGTLWIAFHTHTQSTFHTQRTTEKPYGLHIIDQPQPVKQTNERTNKRANEGICFISIFPWNKCGIRIKQIHAISTYVSDSFLVKFLVFGEYVRMVCAIPFRLLYCCDVPICIENALAHDACAHALCHSHTIQIINK